MAATLSKLSIPIRLQFGEATEFMLVGHVDWPVTLTQSISEDGGLHIEVEQAPLHEVRESIAALLHEAAEQIRTGL